MRNFLRRFMGHTNANVAVIATLAIPVLIGLGGGAVEFGARLNAERELQAIMDGAVLAGVAFDGEDDERMEAAQEFYEATRFRLNFEPTVQWAWDYSSDNAVLTAHAQATIPTMLVGLLGIEDLRLDVRSAGTTARTWGDACWMSMDEHEKHTIELHDEVRIEAPNCLFYGNSDDFDDVVDLHSCDNYLNARMVQTVGGGHHAGVDPDHCPGPLTDYIPSGTFLNAYVIPDPIGHSRVTNALRGAADCGDPNSDAVHERVRIRTGNGRLEPGTYCEDVSVERTTHLEPGTYYFFGDFTIDGARVTGEDVTLIFGDDVNFEWENATVILSAPDTGAYAGMVIMGLNDSDRNAFDGSLIDIEGVVYMPLAKLIWVNDRRNSYQHMHQVQHEWSVWIVEGASWEGDGTVFINFPEGDVNTRDRRYAGYPEELRNIVPESNSLSARLVR